MFNPQEEKLKIFSRRSIVLAGAKFALLSTLGLRLYYLQVTEKDKYKNLAEGNRIRLIPVIPRRGIIRDRNGKLIVDGLPRYQFVYSPPKDKELAVSNFLAIAKIISLPKEKREEIIQQIKNPSLRNKKRSGILVESFLSWENIAKLKINEKNYQGLEVSYAESRNYPYKNIMSHITGYTSIANEKDVKESGISKELLLHPDFRLGRSGLELTKQKTLMGKAGIKEVEIDAKGNFIKDLGYTNHFKGQDIKLTIDVELQEKVLELISGKGGVDKEGASAVVLDIENGDILAMGSVPTFDPNKFVKGISSADYQALINNKDKPFINKAISSTYPPGSTFKPIVAAAALHYGVVNEASQIFCPGHTYLGNKRFDCWKIEGHGSVNMAEALKHSCNVYFYEIAKLMTIDQIQDFAEKLGLGMAYDIDLPNVKKGIVPSRRWKKRNYDEPWYQGETIVTSIGQGFLSVSPLQLAVAAARIGSAGMEVTPRLVIEDNKYEVDFKRIKGIDPELLQVVQSGMAMVVNNYGGTAFRSRITNPNHMMAGKTGSAQTVARVKKENRYLEKKNDNLTHSLFIGYAPIYKPRFAVSVVVEYGGPGSRTAAPIASKILEFAQQKYNI